jgi:hypothetical protein
MFKVITCLLHVTVFVKVFVADTYLAKGQDLYEAKQ